MHAGGECGRGQLDHVAWSPASAAAGNRKRQGAIDAFVGNLCSQACAKPACVGVASSSTEIYRVV